MYRSPSGKILYKFFKEKEEEFQFHLERLHYSINEEDIHYLRRATKRIKALYKLFQQIDPKFKAKKQFSSVSQVFESAGKLRELQVNQNLLHSFQPSVELTDYYSDFIKENKSLYINELSDAIRNFDKTANNRVIKKIKKICQNISEKKVVKSSNELIAVKFKTVKNLFNEDNMETDIHIIRILLKQLNPAMTLMEILQQEGYNKDLLLLFKSVEDKTGSWHDGYILQQSLGLMLETTKPDRAIRDESLSMLSSLEADSRKQLKKIEQKLRMAIDKLSEVSLNNP